eukprot:6153826-Pleurochrysis_carterae.AAC.1
MALRRTRGVPPGLELDDRESRGWTNYPQLRPAHTVKFTRAIPIADMHRHAHHRAPSTRGRQWSTASGARHRYASGHQHRQCRSDRTQRIGAPGTFPTRPRRMSSSQSKSRGTPLSA